MAYFEYKAKQDDNSKESKEVKKLYYEVHGEGKPLVLLNGLMMSTLSWKIFVEPLSANNKLVLLDFFDQGQSDRMAEYNQDLQVEALKALLDYLELDKVALVGISYGGNVALKFTVAHPSYVDRLIVFNAAAKTGEYLKEIGQSWIMAKDNPTQFYSTTIPIIYSSDFYNGRTQWMSDRKEILINHVFNNAFFMEGIVRLIKSAEDYDVEERLGEIVAKTLIVASEYDPITPFTEQKLLHKGIKNSELILLPNCGHASMYEKPALFVTLILGFANSALEGVEI